MTRAPLVPASMCWGRMGGRLHHGTSAAHSLLVSMLLQCLSPLCIVPVPPPPPLQGLHGLILQKCRSCRMTPCCNFGRTCS